MEYIQKSKTIITFNDDSELVSNGSASGVKEPNLVEDLDWLGVTLPGYIRDEGKSMLDVVKIEISINYGQDI